VMKYKYARTATELQEADMDYLGTLHGDRPYLNIVEWGVTDIEADEVQLGLSGSPTKVKTIENVVFASKEAKKLTSADGDINELMKELIASHTLG